MKHERLELKNYFDFIGANGENPTVDTYLPYNMVEMNRQNQKRPSMIVCPGGGYGMCSERESEPIALHFLTEGFNVFVLKYSVAPHRFPTQIREVAALMELIYANAEEWNCDTEKIAIIGFSADISVFSAGAQAVKMKVSKIMAAVGMSNVFFIVSTCLALYMIRNNSIILRFCKYLLSKANVK